jgi:hypothetical protein
MKPKGNILIRSGKDGKPLARTQSGARIYSIKDTNKLMNLAKKATDRESTIALGKAMLESTIAQNNKPTQYTNE